MQDRKSEERKTKGTRVGYGDGTVNGAVDGERYEGQVVRTVHESNQKCVVR